MSETYPYIGARFRLAIKGVTKAFFNEVTIPDMSTDVVEFRAGDAKGLFMRKQPGMLKFGNVVLKSGVTDSTEIFEWFKKAVVDGNVKEARTNFSVILMDETYTDKVRWDFEQGFPVKYDAPDLKAQEGAIAIETLEIAIQGMKRDKP